MGLLEIVCVSSLRKISDVFHEDDCFHTFCILGRFWGLLVWGHFWSSFGIIGIVGDYWKVIVGI